LNGWSCSFHVEKLDNYEDFDEESIFPIIIDEAERLAHLSFGSHVVER
jgi:hypothetical protein